MLGSSTMNKRSYGQNCALALTSDVIGERWSLLLVRDLLVGPRRFKDLTESLRGIGTNLLAARLKALEAAELIERTTQETGAPAYQLTAKGLALEPAVLALVRWGLSFGPENQAGFHHREEWDLVALKALYQPTLAADLTTTVQFRAETFVAWISINDGNAEIGLGEIAEPDIVIGGTIKNLFTKSNAPEDLLISGEIKTLRDFMNSFALPN
jgi:DNA-binding HxlR family transcriptional regulator